MQGDQAVRVGSRISKLSKAGLLVSALAWGSVAQASATVTSLPNGSSASALTLVNTLLSSLPGMAVVAGSAAYTGQASASGTFTNGGTGPTGLGIDRGVVLTTGDARFIGSSAAFAGDSANKTGDFTAGIGNSLTANTSAGNPLFNSLTSAGTFNASILSFQVIPVGAVLTMSFVFGSEDWNDLVNTGFPTDVFGVFVNGVNYAKIGGAAISTSTINCGGPTSGPAPGSGPNCARYRDNAPFFDAIDTELDGLTTVLSIAIPLNVGVINTISIGIADSFDTFNDSALLIRAGSIAAIPEPETLGLLAIALAAMAISTRRRGAPSAGSSHVLATA
jgi:hypothetical protein